MINFSSIYFYLVTFLHTVKSSYISSGLKTLNKFLYSSRFNTYKNQTKKEICSLSEGINCYYTEKKYLKNYDKLPKNSNINDEWVYFLNRTRNYKNEDIVDYFNNYTSNYIKKNKDKVDKNQNSKGEVFQYLLTFDDYDEYTMKKDIYYDSKSDKSRKIFFNKEININIEGKLRLSYDKDLSDYYLKSVIEDYPSKTFGYIESEYITISFQGKVFVCNFAYIKAHEEKSKSKEVFFYGYVGNRLSFTYSYKDNKKRDEKWLKVLFPSVIPINSLIISGPYDIDNISFLFPNKKYEDSNVYSMYNYKNIKILIEDEDI